LWTRGLGSHAGRLRAEGSRIKWKTCHGLILLSAFFRVKVESYFCGVSAPRDEVLLFRQKDPKPFLPVCGPSGTSVIAPNKMVRELARLKQPSPKGRFGTKTPPHPMQFNCNFEGKGKSQFRCTSFDVTEERIDAHGLLLISLTEEISGGRR